MDLPDDAAAVAAADGRQLHLRLQIPLPPPSLPLPPPAPDRPSPRQFRKWEGERLDHITNKLGAPLVANGAADVQRRRDQAKEILSKQAVKITTKAEEHERFIFKISS